MKILIVDDEPGVGAGLAKWFADGGWGEPVAVATSDEAVEWINQHGKVDVLIAEVMIKSTDGLSLRESLLPQMPKMKTVFLSAHDLSAYASRMEGCPLLAKPVTGAMVEDAVRSLFEPKPAAAPKVVSATPQATGTPRAVAATPRVAAVQPTPTPTVAAAPKASVPANPAATPQVTATPRAVAAPSVPTPKVAAATPVAATPRAVPKPVTGHSVSTVAQVLATPTPKAAPRAAAVPQAAPKAAVPKAAAVPAPGPSSEMEMAADDLVGTTIGDYLIEAKIGEGSQGGIYRAMQAKMRRQVRFYTLDRARAQDPAEIQRFIANASVKANVAHPSIFAVYEAGESQGVYFYSCEYVPCRSLRQLREAGQFLDETTALHAMKVASEVLGYFAQQNVTHNIISENAILIGPHDRPRIANTAVYEARETFDMAGEMSRLGTVIANVLPEDSEALGVRELAVHLAIGQQTFPNWPALTQAVTALEPKIAPQDAYKLDAQERAAIRMVEEAKKRQKRGMLISSAVSLTLLAIALLTVWFFVFRQKGAAVRAFDRMVKIPAGEFIYQDGQKVTLPEFYIDEYEVTIAQYAEFLKYLEANPGEAEKFAHPRQPKGKSHVPKEWANMEELDPPMPGYYERAQKWGKFKDAPLDVNCPVFFVDWYDAYAYAKWKGRRLPTEQEWEKAARGTDGQLFPWGDKDDPKAANLGRDHTRDPKKGGEIDGHDSWSPVDAMKKDKSPFNVYGLAGNVSEWTDSRDKDPKMPSAEIPVIKGGNYKTRTPEEYNAKVRRLEITELQSGEALGFRTVSDTPPVQK
jgi:formylglycine-generating enzyme required for sulfatase activity/DNA-binding NarL/FixJ family response regulator